MNRDFVDAMGEMIATLKEYSNAYYLSDTPLASDAQYDELFDKLTALEKEAGIILPDSPSIKVGAQVSASALSHTHIVPLYSLDKVRTREDLAAWVEKMPKELAAPRFSLEYKLDGLNISLTYKGGRLVQAATRGDGKTGESVLEPIKRLDCVPKAIDFNGVLEVQGECFMPLSVLEKLNAEDEAQLKSARNAAVGALRGLDPSIAKKRGLEMFFYTIGFMQDNTFDDYRDARDFLKQNRFPLCPNTRFCDTVDELMEGIDEAAIARDDLDFLIDGMVIKLCDTGAREKLGFTERFPRWAIAYKFAADEKETTVEDIVWQVGRTGKLTPLAHLSPITLCGAQVARATLNNFDDIVRKGVFVGAIVKVRRSNDVIPEIMGAVDGQTPTQAATMPSHCPSCGASVQQRGVHIYCTNTLSCKEQLIASLSHFASRAAMDIDGFSQKTAELLMRELGVTRVSAIYLITYDQLFVLEGFGDKRAKKLLEAIEKSKTAELSRFVFALGIPNVGTKTAKELSARFETLERIRKATKEELLEIFDIGEIVADSIVSFFNDEAMAGEVDELLRLGVKPKNDNSSQNDKPFQGKTFVFTGSFASKTRQELEAMVEGLGARASSSVSKKTDYVVYGESAGSKLVKAKELNVTAIDESAFFALISGV